MDRLRAMQYLVQAVRSGSFSAASRELGVSTAAVSKQVAALERELGATLLHRHSRALRLTVEGEAFHRTCEDVLDALRSGEARLAASRVQVDGVLVLGTSGFIATHAIAPALPELLRRHPHLAVDVREVSDPGQPAAAPCDMLVLPGWFEPPDMVVRTLAATRFLTCASPAFWQSWGHPSDPAELAGLDVGVLRLLAGPTLDRWRYRRGDEVREVVVRARAVFDNRDTMCAAAAAGACVVRLTDLFALSWLESGVLQPAMTDWEGLEPPPVQLMYRRSARATARVKAVGAFLGERFAALRRESDRHGAALAPSPRPDWSKAVYSGRLSDRRAQR